MNMHLVNERGMKVAKRLGVDDAVFLSALGNEQMVRFANDSLTVAKKVKETALSIYMAKGGRRIVGSSSNPAEESVSAFVEKLFEALRTAPQEPNYAPLPSSRRRFARAGSYDRKVSELEDDISDLAGQAISAAGKAGAKRSAGAVEASVTSFYILTSSGTEGEDTTSRMLLNIRSFTDKNSSGHGLSCSATLSGFDPVRAGRRAGEHAREMRGAKPPEAGRYQVLLSPTVASNLVSLMGGFSSAFAVDAGTSYLVGKLGKRVASESFSLTDHGRVEGGLGGRTFDNEGLPTQSTPIIERGALKSYLHNLTTAKKFKTESTANAGWIDPGPWNLEVAPGDSSYDEMVGEVKRGIILTSNWYTRFTNYRTGEFSTVPRDGAYLVEGGRVRGPVSGLRMSDSLERIFSSVQLASKDREWVQWWEVDDPTLCPWFLVDGATVTRAYGSAP